MNQAELAAIIACDFKCSDNEAERRLNSTLNVIQTALCAGEEVHLIGFGTFSVIDTPARKGRNFRTGENIDIPAKRQVKFKPSKQFLA